MDSQQSQWKWTPPLAMNEPYFRESGGASGFTALSS